MRAVILLVANFLFCVSAQALPEQCLQSKARNEPCTHLMYKKSPIDIAELNVTAGDMVCLCLSDVNGIRAAHQVQLNTPELQVTLTRFAQQWGLTEQDLLLLIRK
ncbi:hypothetical protein [Paraglaciecola sp. 20A4]|uniref:hypothetical protein n=1 Tax=Paraglaciecola sp. 20A4 TaxID=2687288 RepID=UPI00140B2F09|nr:hypothetical protein [Paraglaciecola sp. 20A4]